METTDPQPVEARDSAAMLPLYRVMRRIRAFENAAEIASQGGVAAWGLAEKAGEPAQVRGPLHLSTGQEAVAAGVCAALRLDDVLTSTHRGHTKLTPAGRAAFVAMTRPVYDKWKTQIGAPLVTKAEQSIAARKK
jgi:TPP-dependent pyruvate/acetoin dehydrogenase alpha subunit